ncbi:MAG TPA: NADH-quinone oxidoreductase subunit J [Coxiellaceae bacterium]|nr:NADH-quinone oxidoreductase subunit J [Coxiellaceae bacterium]
MIIPVYKILFYLNAAILIGAATMVIVTRNTMRSALFLVLAFVASSVLWMMLQAEFLSLVLIFVYVGAVMTLFLFVIMMLNIDIDPLREGFVKYLPLGVIVLAAFLGLLFLVLGPHHLSITGQDIVPVSADYSNTQAIGELLYSQYLYPFELAAVILLVAIVAAISLAFFGRKPGTKSQRVRQQLSATKEERLRIVKMEPSDR